jgi:putative transposase
MPNKEAVEYFQQACGIARLAWNEALREWIEQYEQGGYPSGRELNRYFNSYKDVKYPFIKNVTKCAAQHPFDNLQFAMDRFFAGTARYPKFKKKYKSKDSFYLANNVFTVQGKYIKIPKLGMVKMTESLRFKGKIMSAVVSRRADKWYVSIQVEINEPIPPRGVGDNQAVGIDLGIKTLAVLSDGTTFENPRIYKRFEGRLRRRNKSLSRKTFHSKNWFKASNKLARLYARMADCRLDHTHKFTHYVAINYNVVCLETLNVKGMAKNHKLAKHILDISPYEVRRQLEYKCQEVWFCDRFAPTSKTCCDCDWVNENQTLKDRVFICGGCEKTENRDLNAAKNIVRWATPIKTKPVDRKALAISKRKS